MTPHRQPPPVRVLQVVLSLNPGGTERLVEDLATRLPDMPTAICCLDEAGTWGDRLRAAGTPVTALGRGPGFTPMLGRRLAAAARAHRTTVIHAHQYTPMVYSALARMFGARVPIVFTEHGRLSDAPASPKRRLANRVLRRAPAATFAVSRDLRRFMCDEGFAEKRVGVIYNGISVGPLPAAAERTAVRRELGLTDDVFLVGSVARLDAVKNLGVLLEAVASLTASRPVTAIIVGDGPERARLEAQAETLGLGSRARFLGQREDARRWLAGCDAYVNCSISEGVSLTILEAMAAALPVIATAVGGTPEVVTPECAILIPARDAAALAAAMRQLAENPGQGRAMGHAARTRVETMFTIERMVADYAGVYQALAQGKAVPSRNLSGMEIG